MPHEVNKVRLTVLIALLFSTLCAGVFRTPPILFMAALLCSAPIVGLVIGRLGSRSLRLERNLPEVGTVGDIVSGELILKNAGRVPLFLTNARAGEAAGAVVSLGDDEHVVPTLRGHSVATWKHQWKLQRRGLHTLSAARAGVLDPLGLSTRLPAKSQAAKITVLPRPLKIEQLGLLGGMGANNQTPRHSTAVADAMDFHGVRAWQPGETIRRAHWKSTAHTGQLHVIEWEETPGADLALLLDTQAATIAGREEGSTLEAAITVAATIASHLLESGWRVQIWYYAAREGGSTPIAQVQHLQGKNVQSVGAILRALAEIEPTTDSTATLSNLVQNAVPQIARGMGVVLLSSSRAEFAAALQRAGVGGVFSRALIFDAESYETQKPSAHGMTEARREKTRDIRSIRHGDSLGAVLEKQW